ncbi:MAG: HAD family phosphatase [Proteobacteria bacterium]|nr:HAD family phosphatase [Pseudomonadota bacterium]
MLIAFDLDGTIADTESQIQPDVVSMLNQEFNVPVTLEYWQKNFHGMAGKPLVNAINQHFNVNIPFTEFTAARIRCWPKLVAQGFNPAPGVYQALQAVTTQNNLHYCICSNSRPERIADTLRVLNGQHSAGLSLPNLFINRIFSGLVENSPSNPNPRPMSTSQQLNTLI